MQAEKPVEQHIYKGTADCLKKIAAEEGVAAGPYKGFVANALRSVGGALVLVLYDRAKTYLGISGSTGAASGIILLKVWQFAAFVDVVLVSSNWIELELKNSHSASFCSPGFRGQRLSLNCFPRTVGSAPHQGACADLNRGCTWACRRLRRACSCSVRVSSASCGVHCASTSNVLRRASTKSNVLGASACSLCRTCFYRDRCLRFSPCRAHRLHLHLW